jgi:hypothetical protein
VAPHNKPEIVKSYQQIVGDLNWLSVSLLLQFMQNPSRGHILAEKQVLAWLSGTCNHGLRYTQGGRFTESLIGWVNKLQPSLFYETFTYADWGPQDASHPCEGVVQLIPTESVRSLLGHTSIRIGRPVAWGCTCEPKTSRSSCVDEIFSMDEVCKTSEMLYHLMTDLKLPDAAKGISMFNNNKGATVD